MLNKELLKQGKTITFRTRNEDDYRECEILYTTLSSGVPRYYVWFNGAILHSGTKFHRMNDFVDKLIDKWDMKPVLHNENETNQYV